MTEKHIGILEQSKFNLSPKTFSSLKFKIKFSYVSRLYEEAVDTAFEQRDLNTLYVIQQKVNTLGNRQQLDKITTYIAMLSSKK